MTHVAQNPTDWKHVQFGLVKPGSTVGCDFAGEVVEVGKEVTGSYLNNFRKFYVISTFSRVYRFKFS